MAKRSSLLLSLLALVGCGAKHAADAPGCPLEDPSIELANDVAAVRPAIAGDYVYYFSAQSPQRLMRAHRKSGASETVLELPPESQPVRVVVRGDDVVYLDRGRGGVYAVVGPESEQQLASEYSFERTAALTSNSQFVFWAADASEDGRALIARWPSEDGTPAQLSTFGTDDSVAELAADAAHVIAHVHGNSGSRLVARALGSRADVTIAELDCGALSLEDATVFCPVGDELRSVPVQGGPASVAKHAAHVLESRVADSHWYLSLQSPVDPARGTVARVPLDGENVQLLTCGVSRPRELVADSGGALWLSSTPEPEKLSLRSLSF